MAKVHQELDVEAKARVLGVLIEVAEKVERDERKNPPPLARCDEDHGRSPSTRPHDFTLLNFQNDQFHARRIEVASMRVQVLRRRLADLSA